MSLVLLPAVDVVNGEAVRLVQGEAGSETGYGSPPRDAALAWQNDGAEWVHLVDLDAAFGRGSNSELLAGVIGDLTVKVELSGGIRDDASLEAALATGCARVNLGTAAIEDPEWCARALAKYGDKIAVGSMFVSSTVSTAHVVAAGSPTAAICGRPSRVWTVTAALVTSSPTSPRTAHSPVPISNFSARCARSPTRTSSPPVVCRPSRIYSPFPAWLIRVSRARSWARHCMPVASLSRSTGSSFRIDFPDDSDA